MRSSVINIQYIFIFLLFLFIREAYAQESYSRDYVYGGLSYCMAKGTVVYSKNAFGLEVGGLRQMNKYYTLGFSADWIIPPIESESVDIPNNLMTGESLDTEFSLLALTMVNHFDLNPDSKVKLFIDAKVGFRLTKFSVTHYGYLIFMKLEEEIYNSTSGGLSGGFYFGISLPLSADSRLALRLKTGMLTGTPIKYIDPETIYFENPEFKYGEEKKSNATYWTNSVDFIWRFR